MHTAIAGKTGGGGRDQHTNPIVKVSFHSPTMVVTSADLSIQALQHIFRLATTRASINK